MCGIKDDTTEAQSKGVLWHEIFSEVVKKRAFPDDMVIVNEKDISLATKDGRALKKRAESSSKFLIKSKEASMIKEWIAQLSVLKGLGDTKNMKKEFKVTDHDRKMLGYLDMVVESEKEVRIFDIKSSQKKISHKNFTNYKLKEVLYQEIFYRSLAEAFSKKVVFEYLLVNSAPDYRIYLTHSNEEALRFAEEVYHRDIALYQEYYGLLTQAFNGLDPICEVRHHYSQAEIFATLDKASLIDFTKKELKVRDWDYKQLVSEV